VESVANPLDQRKVHIDRLKKVILEPEGIFGEAPTEVEALGVDEYEVERIPGHRSASSGRGVEYYVRWKGVPAENIKADECVAKYERDQLAKQDRVTEPATLTYAEVARKAYAREASSQTKPTIQPSRRSTRKRTAPKGAPRSR